jgi:hypothetical protein
MANITKARDTLQAFKDDLPNIETELAAQTAAFDAARKQGKSLKELSDLLIRKTALEDILAQHRVDIDAAQQELARLEAQAEREGLERAYQAALVRANELQRVYVQKCDNLAATLLHLADEMVDAEREVAIARQAAIQAARDIGRDPRSVHLEHATFAKPAPTAECGMAVWHYPNPGQKRRWLRAAGATAPLQGERPCPHSCLTVRARRRGRGSGQGERSQQQNNEKTTP